MRFCISLAALTYTLATVGPLGWFFLFLFGVAAIIFFMWWWPLLLVVGIIYGMYRLAKWAELADRRRRRW